MTADQARDMGYLSPRQLPDGRWIGIFQFIYTFGLVVDITSYGYSGRYYFRHLGDAVLALDQWDGVGDPPGAWIKYKGAGGERKRMEIGHVQVVLE